MPKLMAGLSRMPTYTGLNKDQKYLLQLMRQKDRPNRVAWSNNFGTGKSVLMYLVMLDWVQRYPGILIWFGRTHVKHLHDNNISFFQQIVPIDVWKYKVYGGRKPEAFVFPNGSTIMLVGFNDPSAKLGGQPGAIFIEEMSEISLEMYNYLEGRVGRQPGMPPESSIIFSVGNPRGHYPLYRRLCKGDGADQSAKDRQLWYKGDPMGNKKNLPPGYYEQMLAAYPKELQDRFVLGSDDTHAGQVYPEFNREIHVSDFQWKDNWKAYMGVDVGLIDPTVALMMGYDDATGDVYVRGEYYQPNSLTPDNAQGILKLASDIGFPIHGQDTVRVADNQIMEKDKNFGLSDQDCYSQHGILLRPSDGKKGSLKPGIKKIKDLLMPRAGRLPRLHIHQSCRHTIEEFWMYEWETPKNPAEMLKFREVPKEDYNHCMDALRYGINAMPLPEGKMEDRPALDAWAQSELAEERGGGGVIFSPANQASLANRPRRVPSHPLLDAQRDDSMLIGSDPGYVEPPPRLM